MNLMLLLLAAFAVSLRVVEPTANGRSVLLRIGAFNVQIFGLSKMSKSIVNDILVKTVNRYDILLIQEIRDQSQIAIKLLLTNVNKLAAKSNYQYEMVISNGLGRSTSKEQYAFLYRKDLVSVKASQTYLDSKDVFEREPFIVHFSVPTAAVTDMVFIAIHTKPTDAVREIDSLVDVYDDVLRQWKIKNVVIMGDLNAACNYVKDKEWQNIRLAKDKRFWWLINDCQDTSVQGSRCAYDRFIATGTELLHAIVTDSAQLFDFKTVYNLNETQAEEVSDHFPIEFQIKMKNLAWRDVKEEIAYKLTSSTPSVTKTDVFALRRHSSKTLGYTVRSLYKKTGGLSTVTLTKTSHDIRSAITSIGELSSTFPKLVPRSQSELAEQHLSKFLITSTKYPYQVLLQHTSLSLVNEIKIQLICDVDVTPIECSLIIAG